MQNIGKLIITLALAIFTFIPPIADLATNTHVFHENWTPHARMHTVWLLGITTSLGILSLYLLWVRMEAVTFNLNLAAILATIVYGAFFVSAISAPFYGGALSDPSGGVKHHVHDWDINLVVFSGAFLSLLIGWGLTLKGILNKQN